MKFFIKNMVCSRCKLIVKSEFEKLHLQPLSVDLGEVETERAPSKEELARLDDALKQLGFELIDDRKSRIIARIKSLIVKMVHHDGAPVSGNLSDYLSAQLHYDYSYLSNLFSEVESTTIEKYFIAQRVEKVKELLLYDELSLAQIADKLGYSSAAYLSTQFKKVTGLTPGFFKSMKDHKRKNIEDL